LPLQTSAPPEQHLYGTGAAPVHAAAARAIGPNISTTGGALMNQDSGLTAAEASDDAFDLSFEI
jgi:hypothetical protein